MQQFCFTSLALPLVLATLGDEIAHSLQIKRLAEFREEVAELNDKGTVVPAEAFSGDELSLKKGPCLVYGGGQLLAPKSKEVGSKKKKLLSLMTLAGKKKENREAQWQPRGRWGRGR